MGGQALVTESELPADITKEQLDELIARQQRLGGTCQVVERNGKKFLITTFR